MSTRTLLAWLAVLSLVLVAPAAHAAPTLDALPPAASRSVEDRIADGDLDFDDLIPLRLSSRSIGRARGVGPWLSVMAFYETATTGRRALGGAALLGIDFDRFGAGSRSSAPRTPGSNFLVSAPMARACVSAAWRAHGLGSDDARIDALVTRARWSGVLPELRLRAVRDVDESSRLNTTATDQRSFYGGRGANLGLEARLTWRLDRILYANEEPGLERLRLERYDLRARVAARVLEALFRWQRARAEWNEVAPGTREEAEAALRVVEGTVTLDVLTNGWFSAWSRSAGLD